MLYSNSATKTGTDRPARLRIQARRHSQRVFRCCRQGRTALYQSTADHCSPEFADRRIDLLQLLLDQNETIASIHVIESVAGSLANNAKTTALVTLEQVGPSIDNSSFD